MKSQLIVRIASPVLSLSITSFFRDSGSNMHTILVQALVLKVPRYLGFVTADLKREG